MDAFEFCKEFGRMCKSYCEPPTDCSGCPMNGWNTPPVIECIDMYGLTDSQIRERIGIVEKWSKEHPKKTMIQDFFEKFPDAPKTIDGLPFPCPFECGYIKNDNWPFGKNKPSDNCSKCWFRLLEE